MGTNLMPSGFIIAHDLNGNVPLLILDTT